MKRVEEASVVDAVAEFFLRQGGRVFREVASLGQSADLVWLQGDSLTFVEVKVNAVARAISQCKAHELIADYVCIAVGTRSVSAENFERLQQLGYGLVSCVDGACEWLLRPAKQQRIWSPIRKTVVNRMIGEH